MDLFGLKKRGEKKYLDFINSLPQRTTEYLYDAYCSLDMDMITGNTNNYTKEKKLAVEEELDKRGCVDEYGHVYPSKVKKITTNILRKAEALKTETFVNPIDTKNLEEWDLTNLGLIDSVQFNGYEMFVVGTKKSIKLFGEEDDCGETSVKLDIVTDIPEDDDYQYIEMNSYLSKVDIYTLGAVFEFTDGSEISFDFEQIDDEDDYSLDNLRLIAKYTNKKS